MKIALPHGGYAVWNRYHTVNYYRADGTEYDVSTLYPSDGRRPTALEILEALLRRITDYAYGRCEDCARGHHGTPDYGRACPCCGWDVYPVDECHICGEPIDRSNAPWRTDTCGLRCAAIAVTEDECQHAEWRWLDCEDCSESGIICDVKVCVACGESVLGR